MSFKCNFEEFKKLAMEFCAAAPTINDLDELDNAWKCLGLHYLGMYEDMWMTSAATLLNMSSTAFCQREYELIAANFDTRGKHTEIPSTPGTDHFKG